MKQIFGVLAMALLLAACNGDSSSSSSGVTSLETKMDSLAYAVTNNYSSQMKEIGLTLNADEMLAGYQAGVAGTVNADDPTLQATMFAFQQALSANQGNFPAGQELPFSIDTVSYAVAVAMGAQLSDLGVELPAGPFYQGVADDLAGTESMVGDASGRLQRELQDMMMEKANAKMEEEAQEVIAAGKAFIEEKAQDPNVKSTETGLHYEVLKEGTGASPVATDKVNVHYHGTLIDGTVFDSSVDRGETISFALNRVIPGWTEGLQLMKEGAKYRFYIPYDLAYGLQGSPPTIPGGATLIFDVELFKIEES